MTKKITSQAKTEAQQDIASLDGEGKPIVQLIDGVVHEPLRSVADDRGTLTELFNPEWAFIREPFAYCYQTTIYPGIVKGWAFHKNHKDRYILLSGSVKVVLYDDRPDSRTCGQINEFTLIGTQLSMLTIPEYVWHADINIMNTEAVLMNFPTQCYRHQNPDKFRLPPDTSLIPYDLFKSRSR